MQPDSARQKTSARGPNVRSHGPSAPSVLAWRQPTTAAQLALARGPACAITAWFGAPRVRSLILAVGLHRTGVRASRENKNPAATKP